MLGRVRRVSRGVGSVVGRVGAVRSVSRFSEVILMEHIDELGYKGESVRVKAGYARNYLLPRRLAVISTEETRSRFSVSLEPAEAEALRQLRESNMLQRLVESVVLDFSQRTVEGGEKLYGSVTTQDIATALKTSPASLVVDASAVSIAENRSNPGDTDSFSEKAIKAVGEFAVHVKPNPDLVCTVTVRVHAA